MTTAAERLTTMVAAAAATVLLLAQAAFPAPDHPADRCLAAAHAAAAVAGVPPVLLETIAIAESGRARAGGRPAPWPWTLNLEGEGRWFATEDEARQALAAALAEGRESIDVGCFQINLRWHGGAFPEPGALFDPQTGAQAAARFLAELYAEAGDWRVAAARYHSRDPDRGEAYVRRLEAIFAAAPGQTVAPPEPDPPPRPAAQPPSGPLIDLGRRLGPLVAGGA